ncbi:hypothetical protein BT67DRAFT_401397 [Trichocladium antarcticum]|uniref:Formin GTPase-binding domain-containing protein n=1 Tax=Trichocladium antarcticum TaxID=1450529 RepID=A0AAN6UKS5_9PEZI|nr:hypothetical protein BT67DRAFT_401397 [Trichocladium antarcticum]
MPDPSASIASPTTGSRHQRSKSSVLRSIMGGGHRRNNSDGSGLPPAPLSTPIAMTRDFHFSQRDLRLGTGNSNGVLHVAFDAEAAAAMEPQRYAHTLGELQQNRQERSPERPLGRGHGERGDQPPPSPLKTSFATLSMKLGGRDRDTSKPPRTRDSASYAPVKPKKAKSATNLAALLSRPKSIKSLKQLLVDQDDSNRVPAKEKDKENRTPPNSLGSDYHMMPPPPPPIYAQFANQNLLGPPSPYSESPNENPTRGGDPAERPAAAASLKKARPKSFQAYVTRWQDDTARSASTESAPSDIRSKRLTWGKSSAQVPSPPAIGSRTQSTQSAAPAAALVEPPAIDFKDINKHLEAMLDRRNIPENQRYKMRNLSDTIKMEFIRQDWAEMQAKLERPDSIDGGPSAGGSGSVTGLEPAGQADGSESPKKEKKKHGRGLSLTIVRSGNKSSPSSPVKKQKGDSSIGRHFRTKSSESLVGETPTSAGPLAGYSSGILAKVKGQQLPTDFVAYLQKTPQPEHVEVGKLHKLRLLLRNETVAWTEEFIRQGGMKEIVELLHRIMAVEWREEHEDALLHENLLCLKALCTTDMALQYLHSIHTTLFPALLHMIFDPEKKGPSEFTTRNIITSLLLTYIEAAAPHDRSTRARAVLSFLRDPQPKEEERPVEFVLGMRRERPYRVWCKEVVNVTKEVFWIFLHNLNIVALPSADKSSATTPPGSAGKDASGTTPPSDAAGSARSADNADYMTRHFPQERPPVPAAPYVGGVEWDATNYLASHLDLLNAILSCMGPTPAERNALRAAMRISGWERCMGGSLRLCKEKFYGAVHDGLRTWVAAAAEDGWDVRDVRYGPPPESRSASPTKRGAGAAGGGGGGGKKPDEAPRIEMPKLDFDVGGGNLLTGSRPNEPWLS